MALSADPPIAIPGRFNGPLESGNGGYSAGLFAGLVEGQAAVSLRSPVPLDTPLAVVRDGETVRFLDGETLVAEASPADPPSPAVPPAVSVDEARAAAKRYAAPDDGPFSRCFVCGPAREDSLGVHAGRVEGRDLVASTWTPPQWTAGPSGAVREEIVWAVLDCPTYFAVHPDQMRLSFLVRQSVELRAPIAVGVEHVVIAWPSEADGRKRTAGAAVFSAAGEVLAVGEALLVEARQPAKD